MILFSIGPDKDGNISLGANMVTMVTNEEIAKEKGVEIVKVDLSKEENPLDWHRSRPHDPHNPYGCWTGD